MADIVRVRIAPSPTGKFHIGTARTALFNYLFAKRHEGKFIVRIEDTDTERSKEEFTRDILDGLLWLGMAWDEGPETDGPMKPYLQSQRLDIYRPYVEQLLKDKKAYKCYCTVEEIDAERKAQQAAGQAPKYSGKCRNLTSEQIEKYEKAGRKPVIRFIVEPQKIVIEDLIKGDVEFDTSLIGDFTLVRADGIPLFILSNTIDDNLMQITHVLRGEEHLSNAAKQLLLAKALNFFSPQFGHLPLILNPNRSKMSKRRDPVSVSEDFKAKGYLPEALVNFIALLGWSSGDDREIYSMKELIDEFQIERVGKSPSIFDAEKLLWMNGYYIRHMSVGDLASRAQEFIKDKSLFHKTLHDPEYYIKVVSLVQDRMKTLDELEDLIDFFYEEPEYKAELLVARKSDKERTLTALKAAKAGIEEIKSLTLDEIEVVLRSEARNHELKDGELLWAVRVALTGKEASPGTFELVEAFGKEQSLARIEKAIKKLSAAKV